jgi:hypothetical protein
MVWFSKNFEDFFFNPSPSAGSDNHNCINNVNGEGGWVVLENPPKCLDKKSGKS